MTSLIACLTTGKGTWGAVSELMNSTDWNKVFLVTNKFGSEKFTSQKEFEFILVDVDAPLKEIRNSIVSQLKGKIIDTEVAVNIASGTGKEHMAVISAVLNLGLGLRLVHSVEGKMDAI